MECAVCGESVTNKSYRVGVISGAIFCEDCDKKSMDDYEKKKEQPSE